jgi:hypothetical protein
MLGLAILSGCAHTRMAAWDGDDKTICGNKYADLSDFNKEAEKACGTSAFKVVKGFENTQLAGFSQGFTTGSVNANYKKERCLVYRCNQ